MVYTSDVRPRPGGTRCLSTARWDVLLHQRRRHDHGHDRRREHIHDRNHDDDLERELRLAGYPTGELPQLGAAIWKSGSGGPIWYLFAIPAPLRQARVGFTVSVVGGRPKRS